MILESEYVKAVRQASEKETQEDELKELETRIEFLKQQNELLKMDYLYLGAKRKTLGQQRCKLSRNLSQKSLKPSLNKTFEQHNETLLTFADDDHLNESVLQDLSNILLDKDVGRSLDDQDFVVTIGEIKEEDEEDSDSNFEYHKKSEPLKFESLTNDSTFYKSNVGL